MSNKYYYNLGTFFDIIAKKYADNHAIIDSDKEYTYAEICKRSDEIAAFMQNSGREQGDVIAILSTKSFDDYAAMIAALKLGVAYTNIDIENPPDRIGQIFNRCSPKMLFSSVESEDAAGICNRFGVNFTKYTDIAGNTEFTRPDIDGETVAYIMFTSGSTGTPKGAAITHQNIIHFIEWTTSRYSITTNDNFANISPMYFDNSVFDFYTSIFSGASLTPINKDLLSRPLDLVNYIDEKKCTIWFSVPSMLIYLLTMKVLNKDNMKHIRVFTFGGEGFPKTELKKLYDLYSSRAEIINVYGPTECTCICSSYDIDDKVFDDLNGLPSLGPINQNFSYVVLDDNGNENDTGELVLLGPNVALGYYNDEEKTKTSFGLYTNKNHYRKRMYKTGDLVEDKQGLLFFKGRKDNQIKHMGYRIELEEIEFALNSISYIDQSAVIYKRERVEYGKIIAYVASANDIDIKEIKDRLRKTLPKYMIPHDIIRMESLPKNPNGKVDKKTLALQ